MPTLEQVQHHLSSNESLKIVASLLGCSVAWLSKFMRENGIERTIPVKRKERAAVTPKNLPFHMKLSPSIPLHPMEVRQATPEEIEALEKIPRPDRKKAEFTTGKRRY